MNASLSEQTLQVETLFQGKVLTLERHRVRLPNGKTSQREVVKHPGAVALLALVGPEELLLVRQYRQAVGAALWEIPAGTLEAGEQPAACARRELAEETGYRAASLEEWARFYTAPGFCDEHMTLFLARGLTQDETGAQKDEDEFLELGAFSRSEVEGMVAGGEVRDAKTLLALALWRPHTTTARGER